MRTKNITKHPIIRDSSMMVWSPTSSITIPTTSVVVSTRDQMTVAFGTLYQAAIGSNPSVGC